MRWLALALILNAWGVSAAELRGTSDAQKYDTRAQCEADPNRTRSCCDFTERLRYASPQHDGKLISELGSEMPTRFVCHDPDFKR